MFSFQFTEGSEVREGEDFSKVTDLHLRLSVRGGPESPPAAGAAVVSWFEGQRFTAAGPSSLVG